MEEKVNRINKIPEQGGKFHFAWGFWVYNYKQLKTAAPSSAAEKHRNKLYYHLLKFYI